MEQKEKSAQELKALEQVKKAQANLAKVRREEKAVYAILKQKPDSSREEISEKISKTVRTVQRALDSLKDKGYIKREGSRQFPVWQILK